MDTVPTSHDGPTRMVRGLMMGWSVAGVAWIIVIVLSLSGVQVPPLLVALFAVVSLGILILLGLWKRTRQVWTALKSDDSPSVYLMLTVLGAVAASLFALEGFVLSATGYFSWLPRWLDWLPLLVFALPVLWVVARLRGIKRNESRRL